MNDEPTLVLTPDGRRGALVGGAGRNALWLAAVIMFAAAVSAWALFLRPQVLGGPASYVIVAGTSMKPTLHASDLVIAVKRPSYRVGDIIAYHVPSGPGKGTLIIHRIVGGSTAIGFLTKGDNREMPDQWNPKGKDVDGRLVLRIPRAGLALLWLHTPLGVAVLAALIAFFVMRGTKGEAAPESDDSASAAPPADR
jgi:signal peptidase I